MFFKLVRETKPLNDGSQGFRFAYGVISFLKTKRGKFIGIKGLTRKRNRDSRGWFKREQGECMNAHHFGKRTVYFEHRRNRIGTRKLWHFAG